MTKDERILLIKAKEKDEQAIEQLFENYKKLVVGLSRKYFLVGGDNDDLIQEGMIGLHKAINSFDETRCDNFGVYAKKIVERQMINAIKKANAEKNLFLNNGITQNCDTIESIKSEIQLEDQIISKENMKDTMQKIYQVLSKFEKEVLDIYLLGYNYKIIAKKLDCVPKKIDNALNRIKNKLKFLTEEYKWNI